MSPARRPAVQGQDPTRSTAPTRRCRRIRCSVGDIVRHVGDPIAFIVADDLEQARAGGGGDRGRLRAARRRRRHARRPLEHGRAAGLAASSAPTSPSTCARGDKAATDAAFAKAARVSRIEIVNNRLVANYMETRGIVAEYDAGDRPLHADHGHPGRPRHARRHRQGRAQDRPEARSASSRPTSAAASAPRLLLSRVSAGGDRGEAARPAGQMDRRAHRAFPRSTPMAATMSRSPRWRWTRTASSSPCASTSSPTWAPISRSSRRTFPRAALTMSTGVYDIPATSTRTAAASTPTPSPVDAYRGAGRPEAAYLVERLVDVCGRDTGLGPIEIRQRNFIRPQHDALPRRRAAASTTAASSPAISTGRSTSPTGRASPARAAAAKADGQGPRPRHRHLYRGLRLPRQRGGDGDAQRRRHGDAAHRHADQRPGPCHRLCPVHRRPSRPRLRQDRRSSRATPTRSPSGEGTGGSRSIPLGAVSVDRAAIKLAEQVKSLAGEQLEADVADLELADGAVRVVGTDRGDDACRARAGRQGQGDAHRLDDLRAAGADLSERQPHRRGRDRSRRPASPRSSATGSSTTSARR